MRSLIPTTLALLIPVLSIAEGPGTDRLIQFYQDHASRDVTDYVNYDRLGSAYQQKARETGDPVYYDLAEKAFVQALSLIGNEGPDSAGITAHLAGLNLSEHRFTEAEALAQKALNLKPDLLSVYAIVGDARLEMGEYTEARGAYATLAIPEDALPPRPTLSYLSETREAGLSFIHGDTHAAIRHTLAAIAKASEATLPKENLAWSQFSLGELYFSEGDYSHAEEAYKSALATYPSYHRALAFLGQLYAAQGRYPEAIDLYRQALSVIPLPLYAAALGDIYRNLGRKEEAEKQYQLVDVIVRMSPLNQSLFRREMASFYAEHKIHLDEALTYAQQELASRKDVYTWDVLAWCLFQNGKKTDAADAMTHALAQGTEEPLFLFHAGMIFGALGDPVRAHDYLNHALRLNPNFHIVYADTARQVLAKQEFASAR